ncbi:MAG: hypothetical protein JNN13_05775 [Planctomycetes bacterium]|nr:hypothetical protein [Planctomycetota bacterium]
MWPLVVAVALLLGCQLLQLALAWHANGSAFAYPLDDAYIHLAMARTLAETGGLGITEHAFASASSSPLWLVLLACGWWVLGSCVWLPLGLATSAALLLVAAADRLWRRAGLSANGRLLALVALVLLVPLPTLANSGMEHTLHAWLAVVLLERLQRFGPATGRAERVGLLVVAAAFGAVRLESAFLLVVALGWLAWRRSVGMALLAGFAASLAWLLLGVVSLRHGGFLLPNSIVLKGGRVPIPGIDPVQHGWLTGLRALLRRGHIGLLVATLATLFGLGRGRANAAVLGNLVVVLVAVLLHVQWARLGWFYRYEAYLIAAAVVFAVPVVPTVSAACGPAARRVLGALLVATTGVMVPRAVRAFVDLPRASAHTYRQNVQLGRFLAEHGNGRPVAVNDIGAVALLANAPVLDLVGLADTEVARARRAGTFDAAFVRELTTRRGISLAVVYEDWFPGQLPPEWPRLARWRVVEPFWGSTVAFFAVDPRDRAHWQQALERMAATLPDGVVVTP